MKAITNKFVFIVEDNEMYSLMLDYTLSNNNMIKCICMKTGEDCIKNLELNPMLIILDYWLPGINGKETYEEIKKVKPTIPVVILTRNKDTELEKELLKSGVYDYLYKEENSILQVENIINSVLEKIEKDERKQFKKANIIFCILIFIAVFITLICIN